MPISTETLTSLAMLKVHIDQGGNYLDYLHPFILHVLIEKKPDPVEDTIVRRFIRDDFGLEIPDRVIQLVLKRLARKHPLEKEHGVYRIKGELPDPRIMPQKQEAIRHIKGVASGLINFSKNAIKPIKNQDEAMTAICAFLTRFNIPCLRAYLRDTAIPTIKDQHHPQIVLVSKYILALQDKEPKQFNSFLIVLKGHMLANALLCPDLDNAPKTYKEVTFYLDTPLLVQRLGLEGKPKQKAIINLIDSLLRLGATVATFAHSRDELERVITISASYIEDPEGRGDIVLEARRQDTTKSDLLFLKGQIDDRLADYRINVIETPKYIEKFQIDETAFEEVLADEIRYFNPRAKEYDINSVRSIYALRKNTSPSIIERAKAVLVTSNAGFSQAAFRYGKKKEASREVSSVITDFSLANMAWLKAPLDAQDIPKTELLAFSYAALQPSGKLFEKYLLEIEKLEEKGGISSRDHQLLRSHGLVQDELMNLTLGEEEALTGKTVTEILDRVKGEIRKEEGDKYRKEKSAHENTRELLAEEREKKEKIRKWLHENCKKGSSLCAWFVSISISILLLAILVIGIGIRSNNPLSGWLLLIISGTLIFCSLVSFIFGTSVKDIHRKVEKHCFTWCIKRTTNEIGSDLDVS